MWRIFQTIAATGTSYVFTEDTSRDDALAYFVGPGIASWVAEHEGRVVAMYKLVANRRDRGSHVANASFMVDRTMRAATSGRRSGSTACVRRGAQVFWRCNSTSSSARIREPSLSGELGFEIVGRVPKAFRHSGRGWWMSM